MAALALALIPSPARAEPPPRPGPVNATAPAAPPSRAHAERRHHRLQWKYPRFRPSQYIATLLVSGAALYIERGTRGLPDNNIHGGLLLDKPTRSLLVAETAEGRATAAAVSDVMWHTTQYFPVVDSLLTPLLTDGGNLDAAIQMTLINWQVQTTTFLLTRATHRTVGRRRPLLAGCDEDDSYDDFCGSGSLHGNGSFLSGHTSMAFAGAASACAHHIALPMYGGNAADAVVCGALLTSATTLGVLRIVADKHWWTDVVAGAALGMATGFGIPFFLHYGLGPEAITTRALGRRVALLPMAGPGAAGLSIVAIQ